MTLFQSVFSVTFCAACWLHTAQVLAGIGELLVYTLERELATPSEDFEDTACTLQHKVYNEHRWKQFSLLDMKACMWRLCHVVQ